MKKSVLFEYIDTLEARVQKLENSESSEYSKAEREGNPTEQDLEVAFERGVKFGKSNGFGQAARELRALIEILEP